MEKSGIGDRHLVVGKFQAGQPFRCQKYQYKLHP